MVKVVFPHFEDKNLDRWMAAPRPVQSVVGIRSGDAKELDLSEALKRFHIASIKSLANRLVISKTFAFIYTPRKNEANANNTVVTGNDRDGLFNVSETRNTIKTMQRILTLKGEVSLYC